ncbi:MAG TPA: DUF192 domain-containing protein [Clostridia bacterium]|nr:DUF192 domain-containing protein [Clostridia bacterium]
MADNFFKRFKGLMFRRSMPSDYGLLLSPCNAIHTFSMRFPIDVIFLDENSKIVHIEKSMRPNKIGKTIKAATNVLELSSGMAEKLDLKPNDMLDIIR